MHIPDGFLSPEVFSVMFLLMLIFWTFSFRKANKVLQEKYVPFLALLAAGIFAAQMLNFPIVGGTSGHLMGAALAAILLGPYGGIIVITVVLLIQTFLFGDGGVTAIGANVFNMGVIGAFVGYCIYQPIAHVIKGKLGISMGAFLASWTSIVVAAVAAGLELGASGTIPYGVAVPAMAFWHIMIGVGEGLITVAVIIYILRVKPELFEIPKISPGL
jgi:cobalt/nickel transport system permease protein